MTEKDKLMEQLGISPPDTRESVMEKIWCVSILAEGSDAASRILGRFLKMRKTIYGV